MRLYTANAIRPFADAYRAMKTDILFQPLEAVGQWQSQETDVKTRELLGATLEYMMPEEPEELREQVPANLPWAEDHFQERVSGQPLNPPPSEAWWPFNQEGNRAHKFQKDGQAVQFSHTYPERFWPKVAGDYPQDVNRENGGPNRGIRYVLGDLWDLVELLRRAPGTRQAYLPVWFPEDTGTVHGQRVPCTLGYHFLIRNRQIHCWYFMRSTDLMRHFPDDVYMAVRLVQWICFQLSDVAVVKPGRLTMSMSSLHTFEADDFALLRDTRLAGNARR